MFRNIFSFSCAPVLGLACAAGLAARCGAVDLQIPPAQTPADAPVLPPVLQTPEGKTISTVRAWEKHRASLKTQWTDFLGAFPKDRIPLKTEFLAREELPGFTRRFVKYQALEGEFTDGYLLVPSGAKGRLPGIVVFHPTTPLQAKGVSGADESYPEEKRQGVQLVQRGYVVWCPRNPIFNEVPGLADTSKKLWTANAERIRAAHPGWSGMTRMTWDAVRAADFMESLPFVDARRLGCIGHSLGAKAALYAAAFDGRYRASVSSEGGVGLPLSNWSDPWYFGDRIRRPGFALEHHQLLALAAPRAFLLLAGDAADNDKSWSYLEAARPVYRLYGKPENLGWLNHHSGHRYTPEARAAAEAFLDRHLKQR